MAVVQTTANEATIIGSAMVQYTLDNFSSFTDLGLANGVTMNENITALDAVPDNGATPDSLAGIAGQTVNVTAQLWEFNLPALYAIRGGIDVYTATPATAVTGASHTISSGDYSFGSLNLLPGQNADHTKQSITSVTGSIDGAGAADDWDQVYNTSEKRWYLVIKDGTNFTTVAQDMVIIYDYTPPVSQKLTTGGLSQATRIGIRLTNRVAGTATALEAAADAAITEGDAVYRTHIWDIYHATVDAGNAMTFKSGEDTNPVTPYALSMLGKLKATRTLGDQLMSTTYSVVLA